jgi:cell division septation protein DedD
LAAVASAVLLSTLGAAGTILGAAIGSFVVTVGSAMFAQGLSKSQRRLAAKQKDASDKLGIARAEVLRAGRADDAAAHDSHLDHADERLAEAREEIDEVIQATAPVSWRERLSRLPWKHIGLTTLALFVVALVVITVFELLAGESVSSITGGSDSGTTTIGHVGGGSGKDDKKKPDEQPTGSTSPSASVSPSGEPTETTSPTETQQPSPADSTAPAESTTPTPTPTLTPAETTAP